MTAEELTIEINVLDRAEFIYKGEIYDGNMKSIGYLPDIVYDVGTAIGLDDDECYELTNYLEWDVAESVTNALKISRFRSATEDYNRTYAKVVKELLKMLLKRKGNV